VDRSEDNISLVALGGMGVGVLLVVGEGLGGMGRVQLSLGYCVGRVWEFLRHLGGALNSFHPILCIFAWLGTFTKRSGLL
jgi:hypothetical protein